MAESAGGLGTTMFSGHQHTNRSLPINNKICNQRWGHNATHELVGWSSWVK
jgi:hypothetical protein